VSGRKVGFLLLLLIVGATIETAWNVRGDVRIGPEGCRVMSGRFYGPSYSFEQAAERAVTGAAPRVELRNAFGGVRVVAGAPGTVKVRLRKVVYQPTEQKAKAFADRIELRLTGEGQPLRIATNRDELDRGTREVGFETHLEVEVPPDTLLLLRNEHGRVDVSGIAAAEVESSFDGVAIEGVRGDVKLDSKHGDVSLKDVGGTLALTSRHGGVELSGVRGAAKLDVQHGDLTARQTGALEIAQQFGAVTAEGVAGELVVRAGHAEVHASDVLAKADVETSFAAVRLVRIGGSARAKVDHGGVTAEDVTGGLSVESSYENVDAARVGGPVEISVHHGAVDAKGLAQGARVRGSGGDVEIDGVAGAVDVEVERGSARIHPRVAVAAPVSVSVRNGEAQVTLPEGSRVDVDGESRRGEVHGERDGLTTESRGHRGERVSGRLGGGGSLVKVSADGDVTLDTASPAAIADEPIATPSLAKTSASPAPAEQPAAEARPAAEATPAAKAPSPKTPSVPKAAEAPKAPEAPKP
jgi:hypothetical protein